MKSPQPETKMTYNVVFSLMYSITSIQASGWVGCSLVEGLVAMGIVVLLFNSAAGVLLLKRRRARSPNFSEAAGGAL